MSLYSDYLSNTGRPIHKMAHYFAIYERHFGFFVNRPLTFLEIGTGNGGSCQMWKRYFGPLARIVTLDINPVCSAFSEDQIHVRIGDQSDPGFLDSVLEEFGPPDIVLDDGSHQMLHVAASFDHLYGRMSPTGIYMIEDMHTAYWPDWGGGLGVSGSFVERFKSLIDDLNADHHREGQSSPSTFASSTFAMTAYDSVLVFERAPAVSKVQKIIGDQALRVNY